jgi:hypothetical protein
LLVEEKINNIQTLTWNGTDMNGMDVPPGMYIYKVDNGSAIAGKILKIK